MERDLKALYRDPQATKQYWEGKAARFVDDRFWRIVDRELYDNSWIITVDAFLKGGSIGPRSCVLEVGCGWGRTMVGVLERCPGVHMVGIDIVSTFLERAPEVLRRELGSCDAEFQVGDGMQLPFADASFDAVCTTRVLQYVSEPVRALQEFRRVLRPNGRAVVIVPNQWNPWQLVKYHTKLYSPRHVAQWFTLAGLRVLEARSINYFPSKVHRFRYDNKLLRAYESVMQRLPLVNMIGGLAYVYGEKV